MYRLFLIFLIIFGTFSARAQQIIDYTASDAIIINPERGFYDHNQSTNAATLLNKDKLIKLREDEGISLILMLYYLPGFMEGPISETALANMETNFNTMREAGVKCVLRFAYRSSQNNRPYDPTVEIVEEHIRNLTPVLRSGSDVIAVVQTGFVGVWGEWYYTTNFGFPAPDYVKRNKVVDGLLNALPERRMIQLRTPKLKYGICGLKYEHPITADQAFSGTKNARIGHHNDCFLASSNDYGTYANIEEEKAFLEAETLYLPMGGETCNPSSYSECTNAIAEMERFHWTYLNSDYHQTVLNDWRINGCMDEVQKRLGYRFVLQQAAFSSQLSPGGCFSLNLTLQNQGFAAPFNPRDVEILLISSDENTKYWIRLPDDPRFWLPGQPIEINHEIRIPNDMPEGQYKLYMNLPDPEPELFDRKEYSIQLANENTWDAETGYNDLLHTLQVSGSETTDECDNDLTFLPFPRIPHLDIVSANHAWNISKYSRLFPNPMSQGDIVNLELTTDYPDQAVLRIMSMTGQLMLEQNLQLQNGQNQIQVDNTAKLPGGLYYISVSGARSYLMKKLAIQ